MSVGGLPGLLAPRAESALMCVVGILVSLPLGW